MSTIHISQDVLNKLGGSAPAALTEIACRLYETGKLPLAEAACLAQVDMEAFTQACVTRRIPVYWLSEEDLENDLRTLKKMGV